MAKKSSIERNDKRRKMAKEYGSRRAKLKAIIMNKETPIEERFDAMQRLNKLPRNSAKIRFRNRCELTGRPRAFYGKFRISRLALRELANKGQIPGVIKSSW